MADLVTSTEVNTYLGTTGIDYSEQIKRASAQVESYIGNPVIHTQYTEIYDGGVKSIFLNYYPVVSVTVTDTVTNTVYDPSNYRLYPKMGELLNKYRLWYEDFGRWQVEYTAGLAADIASVPQDIKKATLMIIEDEQQKGSSGYVKEKIGDYSYEKYDSGVEQALALLEPYRRVSGF